MLTPHQSDIAMLSLFYWGLSVLMLRIVMTNNRMLLYGLSSVYLALCVAIGWYVHMKWLLVGCLIFMVVDMLITSWILLKQSRECMKDLKKLRDGEEY